MYIIMINGLTGLIHGWGGPAAPGPPRTKEKTEKWRPKVFRGKTPSQKMKNK